MLVGEASLARIITLGAGFVGLVLTARVLGPDDRGEIAAALSAAVLAASVLSLSLGGVIVNYAAGRPVESWLPRVLGPLILVCVSSGLIVIALSISAQALPGDRVLGLPAPLAVAVSLMVPLLIWEQYSSGMLASSGGLRIYNRAQIIGRPAGLLILVVVLAIGLGSPISVILCLVAAQAIVAFWGIRYLRRIAPVERVDFRSRISGLLRRGGWLHIYALGSQLILNSGVVILATASTAEEAGFLQMAIQLTAIATFVPAAASTVIVAAISEHGTANAWLRHRRSIVIGTLASVPVAVLVVVTAPVLVEGLFGAEFSPAVEPLRILALGIPATTLAMLMAAYWVARGRFRLLAGIGGALGTAALAGGIIVADHGASGPAWIMLATGTALMMINVLFALRLSRDAGDEHLEEGPA